MKNTIISADKLNLIFETADDNIVALKDVTLNINKGEFVSFIGPSGCGKTTFLRAIASLEKPTSGNLTVNGLSPEDARKNRAYGYVFQAAGLYPWRNIYRNVSLPLEIMGYKKNEIPGIVEKVLKLVDLTGFEKKFTSYSKFLTYYFTDGLLFRIILYAFLVPFQRLYEFGCF